MNVLILKKNNRTAKIVADTEANLLDLYKLIDVLKARNSKDTFDIKCVAADIKGTKVIKSNYELGLNGDGSTRICLLYTSPSPRDAHESRMPSSA